MLHQVKPVGNSIYHLLKTLKPAFFVEVIHLQRYQRKHQKHEDRVGVGLVQFRHTEAEHLAAFRVFAGEVHAVDACNKTQRYKNAGDDGEHFHDLVHAVAHRRHIQVHQPGSHLLVVVN